ncbi:hypothetical protein [uncultured Psychroserpens sp.]|uniref:hypothetical protein n=1 Tax=uncultured Psychroserpens sp. TaxID=255436 RepID=UPI0026266B13|nr:hypothetical protein [uncultured Psychroserpens sp.]
MAKKVSTSFKEKAIVILDGYQFCSASKKKVIHDNGFVWCEGNTQCKNKACSTRLFSRDKEAPQDEPDSWEFEAKSNIKIRAKDARVYHAFCVDKIKL